MDLEEGSIVAGCREVPAVNSQGLGRDLRPAQGWARFDNDTNGDGDDMGLLGGIRRRVRQMRARRRFQSCVDEALVEKVLSNPTPAPQRLDLEFVLALVEDDDLDRLPELLGQAAGAI